LSTTEKQTNCDICNKPISDRALRNNILSQVIPEIGDEKERKRLIQILKRNGYLRDDEYLAFVNEPHTFADGTVGEWFKGFAHKTCLNQKENAAQNSATMGMRTSKRRASKISAGK